MKKIKALFRSLSLSSEYDKILLKINASDDFLKPNEDMILKIKQALEGNDQEINQEKAVEEFFGQFKIQDNWQQCMKTLYILHKLIHIMKLNVTQIIIDNDVTLDLKANLKISNQSDEIHVPIVLKYYLFQKQIAKYFNQYYQTEQFFQSENLDYIKNKCTEDALAVLNPLISILKNIFKVNQNLAFSLQNFQKYEITKYFGLILIKDVIMIYDFISSVMTLIKDRILDEEINISLKLYEAYEDIVILTKNIEKMHDLRNFTIDPFIKKPRYFKIEKENNRLIELHINQIHKRLNNTDNVAATVSKSVNESSIQQHNYQQSVQNNGKAAGQFKYIIDTDLSSRRKQESNRPFNNNGFDHNNKNVQAEMMNMNQRSEVKDGDDEEERINLAHTKAQIQSGHNMSGGQQYVITNFRIPEISNEQNKIQYELDQKSLDEDNLYDSESSENQRIYVNNLCTKNDKIQPIIRKEKRSQIPDEQKAKVEKQLLANCSNGQSTNKELFQSNSIIDLMFDTKKKSLDNQDD